ncbi:hypothetical protein OEZ86_001188 [Tetradesmus obliquus]|nr:hypothetical protein OEZ86_001188 [Tetradesmus obliquus]
MCVYPATPVLLASCSADTTLKLWTHEPKSLHSTKPLLQTLYGHTAAVTCVAAVHSFLVSGGADGAVLLWKPADSGLLAIPQFQLVAKLFSSEHWVLSLSCRLQPSEAGAAQGIFVAVANQPLLRLQLDKWAVQQAGRAGSSSQLVQSCCQAQFFAQSNTGDFIPRPAKRCTEHSDQPAAASATGATAIHSLLKSQSSKSSRSNRQPVSFALRSNSPGSSMKPASQLPQSTDSAAAAAQDLSVFAVQFVAMELAVLTLAYDGCCRLHSAVDGGLRCCWRSPTGSRFTAMGCTEHDTRSEIALPPLVAAPDESANSAAAAAINTNSTTPDLAGGGGSSDVSSPACMMLVSGGLDNRVLQWDLAGGPSVLASLDVGQVGSELSAVTYLQGWSILATGGVPSSRAFQVLHGHTAAVTGLEVVQGNGVLVSCGRDGRLLQWDYATGQLLAKQQLQGQELLCLAVRQDSRQVYVGSSTAQLLSFQVVDRQQCDAAEQSGADEAVHAPTCHDLARAVDSHTVTALCIKRWGASPFTGNTKRLFSVNTIQLLTKPDWDHLEKLAAGLQQLRTLQIPTHVNSRIGAACAAALTGLTRLDLGTSGKQVPGIPLPKHGTVQLACLKAASFSSSHSSKLAASAGNGTLQDIAAFAPNLEQLYCQCLEIDISSSSAANGSNVLPYCSHFGGQEVHIVGAASKAAGGAAFAKAFPKLRVISCLPHTIKTAAEQKHHGKWSVAPGELLALRKSIHAVRGCGAHAARALDSTPSSSNSSSSSSSRVAQLAAVSIHAGMSSSSTLLGVVGQLRQVQRLELLLGAPLSRHGPSPTHRASFLRDMHSGCGVWGVYGLDEFSK